MRNKLDENLYAVKRIKLHPKQLKVIQREAKLLSKLRYKYICGYYQAWTEYKDPMKEFDDDDDEDEEEEFDEDDELDDDDEEDSDDDEDDSDDDSETPAYSKFSIHIHSSPISYNI